MTEVELAWALFYRFLKMISATDWNYFNSKGILNDSLSIVLGNEDENEKIGLIISRNQIICIGSKTYKEKIRHSDLKEISIIWNSNPEQFKCEEFGRNWEEIIIENS